MKKSILCLATALFSTTVGVSANNGVLSAQVVTVIDGNTVEVRTDANELMTVILADIDCPELTQEFGDEAKRFLEKLALKKEVTIELRGKDRKGNNLAILLIKGKTDARIELLQKGLAWTQKKIPTRISKFTVLPRNRMERVYGKIPIRHPRGFTEENNRCSNLRAVNQPLNSLY